jgi:hypothetical protein
MARERFLVARFDKRTGKQTEIVFSTLDKAEAERVSAKYNDDLSPRQRNKIEYRWQPGDPFYNITMGCTPSEVL